jgi:hypothetical protein
MVYNSQWSKGKAAGLGYVERLKGCGVGDHDCDKPRPDGATWVEHEATGRKRAGWCPAIAEVAAEVRNVILPFPIEPTHGAGFKRLFQRWRD